MRIIVVSDFHFGYDWDGPRREESFEMAKTALKLAIEQEADLILHPGDIFDSKIPKQEVWKQALQVLSLPRDSEQNPFQDMEIIESSKDVNSHHFTGIPIIAIHGTHERRSKTFVNPVEILDEIGYLVHLHSDHIVLKKKGKENDAKVAIHGLSGVPEEYASQALQQWGPEPVPSAYNILLLHQSIKGWVYSEPDSSMLSLETLPAGFDLIIDGHIHRPDTDKHQKNLVFPGSTITTQIRQTEAGMKKGILAVDTERDELEFIELPSQRAVYYQQIEIGDKDVQQVAREVHQCCQQELEEDTNSDNIDKDKRPLLRLMIKDEPEFRISELKRELKEDYLLSLGLKSDETNVSNPEIGEFEESEKSIFATGLDLLAEHYPVPRDQLEDLFEVLAESDLDTSLELIQDLDVEEEKQSASAEDEESKPEQESDVETREKEGQEEKKTENSLDNYLS